MLENSCEEKLLGETSKLMFFDLRPIGATWWRPFIKFCSVCGSLFSAIVPHNERYNIAKGTIGLKGLSVITKVSFKVISKLMTYKDVDQNLVSNFLYYFMFKIWTRLQTKKLEQRSLPRKIPTLPAELSNWHNSYLFLCHQGKTPFKYFSEPVPTDLKFVIHCCFVLQNFLWKHSLNGTISPFFTLYCTI